MIATVANMREVDARWGLAGVFAYSPRTGERYSANPADYWLDEQGDSPLRDSQGRPMVLSREVIEIVEVP